MWILLLSHLPESASDFHHSSFSLHAWPLLFLGSKETVQIMLLLVTGYLKVLHVPFIMNPGLDLAHLDTSGANTWSSSPRLLLSFHIDFLTPAVLWGSVSFILMQLWTERTFHPWKVPSLQTLSNLKKPIYFPGHLCPLHSWQSYHWFSLLSMWCPVSSYSITYVGIPTVTMSTLLMVIHTTLSPLFATMSFTCPLILLTL